MSAPAACENSRLLLAAPRVVGSVSAAETLGRLDEMPVADLCEIVEFRLDAYPNAMAAVVDAINRNPVKSLAAARDPKEGGINSLGLAPRQALLAAASQHADLIDVELSNFRLFRQLIDEALDDDVLVIASFHDFQGMPSSSQCGEIIQQAADSGASVAKLAVTPRTASEVAALINLLDGERPLPISVMAMGPLGRASRLLLAQLGSCLNYGYLDEATVAGQWPAGELKRLLEFLSEEPAT
jgi:3-dehydroquinate dehydratase-1